MKAPGRALVAAGLSGCLLLAGCAELTDIDQKALVVGVALDSGSAPDTNVVGIQYLVPGQGQGGQGGAVLGGATSAQPGQGVTVCDQATSVGAALQDLRDETERLIYLGNLGVIAVGQALAQQDVVSALNYFLRDGQVAEATQLVVVQGRACAFLQNRTSATSSNSLALYEYMSAAERATFPASPNVLWRFLSGLLSPAEASYAPLVGTSEQGAPFRVLGTAFFLRGRLVGQAQGYHAAGFDWLLKKSGYPDALVNLPGSSRPVSVHVRSVARRIRVLGPAHVALTMRFNTTVREGGVTLDARDLGPLQASIGNQLQSQIRALLDQLQAQGTDVLGIGDRVLARYPGEAGDWPAVFSHTKIDLRVQVRLYEGGRML